MQGQVKKAASTRLEAIHYLTNLLSFGQHKLTGHIQQGMAELKVKAAQVVLEESSPLVHDLT